MLTHEIYCSLDICKLLKQAGFDWECNYVMFDTEDNIAPLGELFNKGHLKMCGEHIFLAPTLAVAQKWLREVKDTIIDVNSSYLPKGYGVSYCVHWKEPNKMMQAIENSETSSFYKMFSTYEEAQEAGIKKALEIILEKGE